MHRCHGTTGPIGVAAHTLALKRLPMRAQISQSMSERDQVRAAIARIEAKRDAQTGRRYYELCLRGWEAHLKRLG
jgi:hypothetical protein